MTLEDILRDLTSRTPSGGCCSIGDCTFTVYYCTDSWEWEYRDNVYYDLQDLAEAILSGYAPNTRLVSFFTGRIPDQRRWPRTSPPKVPPSYNVTL
jgi:hypothetical protein